METPDASPSVRCAMVAVIGRANVGKSTLVNRLVDEKVSIVSPVAQTTRNIIRAIRTEARGQLVFLDTPGIHRPLTDLGKAMNTAARSSVEGVDVSLLVLDASVPPAEEDVGWLRRLLFEASGLVFALNKRDLGDRYAAAYRDAWRDIQAEKQREKPADWIAVSAENGYGAPELLQLLFDRAPMGPQLFPDDVLTDFPRKLAMADIIREKFFLSLTDEVPHHLAVRIDRIDEREDGWHVFGTVYVSRNSQKGIVIGNKGRLLKRVKELSEQDLSETFGRPTRIDELWVKVEKSWMANYFMLKQLGYRE